MTPKDRVLTALRRGTPDRIPIFEWFIDSTVLEALCETNDPIVATERLDLDAVNVRADYAKKWKDKKVYVDEWGIEKTLTGDVLPAATGHPIQSITEHAKFTFPDVHAPERFKTLERALKLYGDYRAVVLNLRDGFSDMRDLLGYENALMTLLTEPEAFNDLMSRVVDYNVALAEVAVERYGVQIVATTDDVSTARGPIISPKTYAKMIAPHFCRVMKGYRDLGLLTIKHSDGDVRPILSHWLDAGIDCLDPIDPTGGLDMAEMKQLYGDRICLKGNIDCTGNLCDGTPEQVDEEVRICIEKGGRSGLIVSSSNTIHRGVKPENFRAMIDAVRKYGA
ncbi:MAG: uroporphyrinogen decarboxylase family protein [Thermoguttaceae bacterium]